MKTDASKSVVKIGDGRGFVVEHAEEWPPNEIVQHDELLTSRLVITAAALPATDSAGRL